MTIVVRLQGENKVKIGQSGENTAENYLKKLNYKIIERNFRCKAGEIDLIVERNGTVAFVEVKTRNSLKYGMPSESVTHTKQKHLIKTATWFLVSYENKINALEYRFDVVEVLRHKGKTYINHIENAFQ